MKNVKKVMLLTLMCTIMISCNTKEDLIETIITTEDVIFNIDENSEEGTTIGTVPGTTNTGAAVNFSFTSQSKFGALAINATTGVLTVSNDDYHDFETNPTFTANVKVADGSVFEIAKITVNLNDVIEGKLDLH
jgi:hypothetical protein